MLQPRDQIKVDYQAQDASGLQTAVFSFEGPRDDLYQVRADGAAADSGPATALVGDDWVGRRVGK